MQVLIADDDPMIIEVARIIAGRLEYPLVGFLDGSHLWQYLQSLSEVRPSLFILDWEMPEMNGLELCEKIRTHPVLNTSYIVFLTGNTGVENQMQGLSAGADLYMEKPFDPGVLQLQLQAGARRLKQEQPQSDILPLCFSCRSIENDEKEWIEMNRYLLEHWSLQLNAVTCPKCSMGEESLLTKVL